MNSAPPVPIRIQLMVLLQHLSVTLKGKEMTIVVAIAISDLAIMQILSQVFDFLLSFAVQWMALWHI